MRHIALALAALATAAFTQSASAADMPAKAKAPKAPVAYNWTGPYLGLHAGGVWGESRGTDVNGWNAVGDTFTADTSGFNGGGQLGYNWQIPQTAVVLGLEGDLGYLGAEGSRASALSSDTFVNADGGWYGTIRGRLGFAPGNGTWLFYGTGGVIFANVKATVQDNSVTPGGGILATHPDTGTQTGSIFGGGAEVALSGAWSGWSAKGEYLYYNLGTKRVNDTALAGGTFRFDIKNTGNIVRLGLNRKF